MNRRGFIRISSVALLPIAFGLFPKGSDEEEYSIEVVSNRAFGHLLREKSSVKPSAQITTDVVIVGGGVAGISAALGLKNKDFILFEGSDRLGGSSASGNWKSAEFGMGAHYELAYPDDYGKEVIDLLTKLDILAYNPNSSLHEFVDRKYVIKKESLEQCYTNNELLEDVLSNAEGEELFYEHLEEFTGKMPLPTRFIRDELKYLNELSFSSYLEDVLPNFSKDLKRRIDYQMLDDWGGTSEEVSALAGIHYYTCRPYNTKDVELFSPPNGNMYFIEKMIGNIANLDALKTNTFVRLVEETENGVRLETLSKEGVVTEVFAKNVIYAGQKHALKYILPAAKDMFKADYAPWVVVNLVCEKGLPFTKWQNDVLTDDLTFLGFVNSVKQHTRSNDYDVLTVYYCFKSQDRQKLVGIEENPRNFIDSTIHTIENETNVKLANKIKHVNLKVMGHAMPIPAPGYLSMSDIPVLSDRIVFAGVDTGRLPLFSEACDSGLQAANTVNNLLKLI